MGDEVTSYSKVICYSGYAYAERPVAFVSESSLLEVSRIESEWTSPTGKGFIVKTLDGRRFKLNYNDLGESWQVIPA